MLSSVIDAETVKEIDSIYARKRLRDEARAKRRSAAPTSAVPGAAAPPQSPSATSPEPARPASSGEPRAN